MAEVLSVCVWPECYELVANAPACEHHGYHKRKNLKERKRGRPHSGNVKTNHRNISKGLRKKVLTRDGHRCRMCGVAEDLTLDHRVPVSEGGLASYDNLWTLCRTCHNVKEGMGPHTPPSTNGETPT